MVRFVARAVPLQFQQKGRVNGLDLRHDQVGTFLLNHPLQRFPVQHADDVASVGHLHGRGMGITVHGDHLHAEALRLDGNLLAQLSGPQQ
jgi:hypothetical protein